MYDSPRRSAEPDGPSPETRAAPAGAPHPLAALATAAPLARSRTLGSLQASAGNQSVARAIQLMREPAAPATTTAAPDPSTAIALANDAWSLIQSAWPNTGWQQARVVLDVLRPVPGLGIGTGIASDVMAGIDDWNAVPAGDPVIVGVTEGLILFRTGLNTFHDVVVGLLEIGQLAQIGLTALTASELGGGATAPAAVPTGLATLAALAGNTTLQFLDGGTQGVGLAIDSLIAIDATTWALLGPAGDQAKWLDLAANYWGNALGDLGDLAVITSGLASFNEFPSAAVEQLIPALKDLIRPQALIKVAMQSALKALWNVRGGDVLKRGGEILAPDTDDGGLQPTDPVVAPGSEIGFGMITQGYERGEEVLGGAASDYAELRQAAAAIAKDGTSQTAEQLNTQLPLAALDFQQRLASVEQVSGTLDSGMQELDAFAGGLDELVATLSGITLDGVPEALLPQVQPLVDRVKETALTPLQAMQASVEQARTALQQIAPAAESAAAAYRQGLEQLEAAQEGAAALGTAGGMADALLGAEEVPIDEALAEWRALGPQIEQPA